MFSLLIFHEVVASLDRHWSLNLHNATSRWLQSEHNDGHIINFNDDWNIACGTIDKEMLFGVVWPQGAFHDM